MVLEILRRHFPYATDIESSDWYRDLEALYKHQHRILIIVLFAIGFSMAIGYVLVESISGGLGFQIIPIGLTVILTLAAIWLAMQHRMISQLSTLILILGFISFLTGVFRPMGRHVYILAFFSFPVLALCLKPIRQALIWVVIMLILAFTIGIVLTVFDPVGILPAFRIDQSVMGLGAYILISYISITTNIRQTRYLERIIKEFCYDELTGCPTRRILVHSVQPEIAYIFCIARIQNLDELHAVFGQELTEKVLRDFVDHMRCTDDLTMSVFKLQFQEFGILIRMPALSNLIGDDVLRTLADQASRMVHIQENAEIRLDVRIGGALVEVDSGNNYLSQADLALQECLISQKPYNLFSRNSAIRTDRLHSIQAFGTLIKNIEDDTLEVFFQPLVDASHRRIVWYECLLRIRNAQGIPESPVPYLAVAETIGMIARLSDFVLEKAAEAIIATGKNISVNITLGDMFRPKFLERIRRVTDSIKGSQGNLILEVVEAEELADIEGCARFIKIVRRMGCQVALDDFGSGYANFSNILRLPFDYLKIDGSLVRQIHSDPNIMNLIDGVITICKKSGIHVVAEYVDSESLADLLKERGVDFFQGFLFGRPEKLGDEIRRIPAVPVLSVSEESS